MMTCCAFVYSVINLTKTKQYVFLIPVMIQKVLDHRSLLSPTLDDVMKEAEHLYKKKLKKIFKQSFSAKSRETCLVS
jgi:hypothetical protein